MGVPGQPGGVHELVTGLVVVDPEHDMWQCFWRLMQQRIVVKAPSRLPRPRRREEQRHGSSRTDVTILRLRHTKPHGEPGKENSVEWTRRWLVRGHWRNQW